MKMKKKWGYEVRRRGLHKLWSVGRLDWMMDDGSEDLVVFRPFFLFLFFYFLFPSVSISVLHQTNLIESNTKKRV